MKNAVALGTFDGLHKGHLAVLNIMDGYKKIALTFENPPKSVIRGQFDLLMSPKLKARRLLSMGIEPVFLKFSEISDVSALDFLNMVKQDYSPDLISCGFNYRFGKGGKGDLNLLKSFCDKSGITLKIAEPVKFDGEIVSSTRIRDLLKDGETEKANRLLSEPFTFQSEVIKGDGRGKTLGFPTINQVYPKELVKIKSGVYKSKITVDGKVFDSITNLGRRPTFPLDYIISETYILNFSGNLYGKSPQISLLRFLRNEIKFSSAEELKTRIENDIKSIIE